MARKPLQFQAPEKLRREIEVWVKEKEVSLSEFLRHSARIYMIIQNYTDQGYKLVLKKDDEGIEKEVIIV